jgi:hypothetical protein
MNHNEPGFLQRTIEGRRSSDIPGRASKRKNGKHSFPKASNNAYAVEQKIHGHSHRPHTVPICIFELSLSQGSGGSLKKDVSFAGLRFIQHWRIAN